MTQIAKEIASSLRSNRVYHFNAKARSGKVFIKTSQPTWIVTDLLPPGWGARQTATEGKLVVLWVG